jgi:hypothetical protein
MTWLQMFMAYYVGYQLISFLRYCYRYGRQGAGPGSEGWMDYFETEGEDPEQELLGVSGEDEQGEGAQAEAVAVDGAVGEGAGGEVVKSEEDHTTEKETSKKER